MGSCTVPLLQQAATAMGSHRVPLPQQAATAIGSRTVPLPQQAHYRSRLLLPWDHARYHYRSRLLPPWDHAQDRHRNRSSFQGSALLRYETRVQKQPHVQGGAGGRSHTLIAMAYSPYYYILASSSFLHQIQVLLHIPLRLRHYTSTYINSYVNIYTLLS